MGYGFFNDGPGEPVRSGWRNPIADEMTVVRNAILLTKIAMVLIFSPFIIVSGIIWLIVRAFKRAS